MKPMYYVLMITILLVGLTMFSRGIAVRAQSGADAPASASGNYLLPLVMGSGLDIPTPAPTSTPTPTPSPTPAQATQIKSKSGIHMGNRGSDWLVNGEDKFLFRLRGTANGKWPASVVVLSDQLYTLQRFNTPGVDNPLCRVSGAAVKSPHLYEYLTAAVAHGTKVIIRIHPSPGNFQDYDSTPGSPSPKEHRTLIDDVPAGGNYCPEEQQTQQHKIEAYRDIRDIINEMKAIFDVNTDSQHDWPPESFYFEPANEPNYEWYEGFRRSRGITTTLSLEIDNSEAWANMDSYFNALISLSQSVESAMQMLTPSMSQAQRAERLFPGSCDPMTVLGGVNEQSGYDFMPQTYLSDRWAGYSWHNYWDVGQESWEPVVDSIQQACNVAEIMQETYVPQSHHVSQYFSYEMRNQLWLTLKPSFISEADLNSPCQGGNNPLVDKDATLPSTSPVTTAQQSLQTFIAQEQPGRYTEPTVNVWLLVNEYTGGNGCHTADNQADANYEINWHEAYGEDGAERAWFAAWWLGDE